jgi:hypothetical protein
MTVCSKSQVSVDTLQYLLASVDNTITRQAYLPLLVTVSDMQLLAATHNERILAAVASPMLG